MIGYCTKDSGKSHYQIRSHNISPDQLNLGRQEHQVMLTSFDDEKKIITTKNLTNECYRFNQRCLWPAIVPPQYVLLYMCQSGEYIISPDFISIYKNVDLLELQALWELIHSPAIATIDLIMKLLFDERSYGTRYRTRYWVASIHSTVHGEPEKLGNAARAAALPAQQSNNETDTNSKSSDDMQSTSSESNVQQEDRRSRGDKLIDLLRSRPRERFPQLPLQIDDNGIVPLPREPVLFTLDREGERVNNTEENFVCPEKLEDMLVIVRNLREQRQRALVGFRYRSPQQRATPSTTSSSTSTTRTNEQQLRGTTQKQGYNRLSCPNISDM